MATLAAVLVLALGSGCATTGPVAAVTIPVTDLDRAAVFYGAVLDVAGTRDSATRHRFGTSAALICIVPEASREPAQTPITLRCRDLAAAERAARRHGAITLARDDDRGTIEMRDPFGNRLTLTR